MPLQGAPLEAPLDFHDLLSAGLAARPDEPALASRERAYTSSELGTASRRVAAHYEQIIVHEGSYISPQEVKATLLKHEAATSDGVVGMHDLVHGENACAYVTLKKGVERPEAAELIKLSRS